LQGIGVSQDYVLAYVWQNLATVSQSRYNQAMVGTEMGNKFLNLSQKIQNDLYEQLTPEQKNRAQILLDSYVKNYIIAPSDAEERCASAIRMFPLEML